MIGAASALLLGPRGAALLVLDSPAAAASCLNWHPDVAAATGYARHRDGDIAFAVRTPGHLWGYRVGHVEWSASMVKAMLLVAYLDRRSVAHRSLDDDEHATLRAMIDDSSDDAANRIIGIVGADGLDALAQRVGMRSFEAEMPIWGETHVTGADLTRFFLQLPQVVTPLHRAFAMRLLASVTPVQRWGIGEVTPAGWRAYFKGGWGAGTGTIDSQTALLTRGCARVAITVLTMYDPSHAYGMATLRALFARLTRGLAAAR